MDASENLNEYFAAIVESSDDAIITKNLHSIIQTWNKGAERLFGYSAEEAIGQSIMMLIPEDRQDEEVDIINRLHRGERIDHFETVRKRKDGALVPISLTISPVQSASGEVIGASKIARDISLQKEAAERQNLLLAEMRHRVGNCFAVAGSLITVSARQVETAGELASLMRERLMALSVAHRLAVIDPKGEAAGNTSLHELIASVVGPFAGDRLHELNIEDLRIASDALTPMALVLYELCTNATKYGALCHGDGGVEIKAYRQGDRFFIDWQEHCGIQSETVNKAGFGTKMCDGVVKTSLGGTITRQFRPSGLRARIDLDLATLEAR
ncbi:PAS domain S-box protein [Pontibaca salina]|uniref:histidine kinase n=1 Tax=Pontibaca salina TaxID=2795731 RepID=A0A934M0D8_9RHOB|nr:PAS domain S-box protein [Pontibaca salina]MBI6629905.1 PAS domain S-box protein [Pontibaca salina]